ncbi:MAG TPA: YkgJ family cysteine cluster protein [Ideonella sp.]|nr:YkgJ family cysteine cluster protein [Ideonella sp.]HEX5686932.1 YkgJ family cysteine cluster protein [Ideonella sp.]
MPDMTTASLACRTGCGACCTAPSISSPIPGMPHGKPAGVPCVQLDEARRCRLFGDPRRPVVCGSLQPSAAMCGPDRVHAMHWLTQLETQTHPGPMAPH